MRYSVTLPIALAALAAAPVMAQDADAPDQAPPITETAPPAGEVPPAPTDTVPAPADPMAPVDTTTDPSAPLPPPTTTDAAPEPAAPAATSEPATPATGTDPAAPAATTSTAPSTLNAEQRAAYDAWPANAQTYFNGLTPARQELFLRITDEDKLKVVALDPAQQEQVWTSLEQQAATQEASEPRAN